MACAPTGFVISISATMTQTLTAVAGACITKMVYSSEPRPTPMTPIVEIQVLACMREKVSGILMMPMLPASAKNTPAARSTSMIILSMVKPPPLVKITADKHRVDDAEHCADYCDVQIDASSAVK